MIPLRASYVHPVWCKNLLKKFNTYIMTKLPLMQDQVIEYQN